MTLTTKIEAEIIAGVDKQSFDKARKTAKDTGVKINKDLHAKLEINIADAQIRLKTLRKQLRDVNLTAKQRTQIQIETNRAQRNVTELKRKLNNLENTGKTSTSRLGRYFKGIGKNIVSGLINPVTLAISTILGLGKAVVNMSKTAIAFESAFAGVKKTIDATNEEYKILKNNLLDLSKSIPVSFEELSGIAELGGQLGIAKGDIIDFTKTIAEIGVSTTLSVDEAATAFAQLKNVVGFSADEYDNLGSALVALGNNSATTETQIIAFAQRIGASGKLAGLSAQEILGIGTAFASAGIKAEAGGTAIQKTLNAITGAVSEGGKELDKFASVSGLTSEEFATLWKTDASEGFTKFIEGLGASGTDGIQILEELGLGSERTTLALLSTAGAGDLLRDSIDLANKSFEEGNALQIEAAKRFETTESQLQLQRNTRKAMSSELGETFNKIWLPVWRGITNAVQVFFDLWKVEIRVFKNVMSNISTIFQNFPSVVGKSVNLVIGGIEGLINKAIGGINKLTSKLQNIPKIGDAFKGLQIGEVNLGRVETGDVNFTPILKGVKEVFQESEKLKQDAVDTTISGINEELQNEISALDKLKNIENEKSGLGSGTSKKKVEDNKEALNSIEEQEKASADKTKAITEQISGYYKDIGKAIEDSQKKLDGYDSKIESVSNKIAELGQTGAEDIADRVVAIQEELSVLDEKGTLEKDDLEKKIALEKELALAKASTTEEDIARAELIAGESVTEKLIRENQEKKQALETELVNLKAEKEQEALIQEQLIAKKEELETRFSDFLITEKQKELNIADQLIAKWKEVARARSSAMGGGGIEARATGGPVSAGSPYLVGEKGPEMIVPTQNGRVIPNNEITINTNVSANVNNDIDIENLANKLARKTHLSIKGIL